MATLRNLSYIIFCSLMLVLTACGKDEEPAPKGNPSFEFSFTANGVNYTCPESEIITDSYRAGFVVGRFVYVFGETTSGERITLSLHTYWEQVTPGESDHILEFTKGGKKYSCYSGKSTITSIKEQIGVKDGYLMSGNFNGQGTGIVITNGKFNDIPYFE